jgi:hypothetical protein
MARIVVVRGKNVGGVWHCRHVYARDTVELAKLLSNCDILDRENAEICGVSIAAVRHWRRGTRRMPDSGTRADTPRCSRCHGCPLDELAYSYLLGLYLGDGHITPGRRNVYALSITCCDAWPGLMEQARAAMSAVMPASSVFAVARIGCTQIKSTSKHWPCLFPQHGPGRKHERRIELQPWQQEIVDNHPGDFARGLFHSDGCRSLNRVRRPVKGGDRWYEYSRYLFRNYSADILQLCGETLDQLGVAWRFSNRTTISVARREAVARLDEFVGPKY